MKPSLSEYRKDIAKFYRSIRKDNPAIARLLHRKIKGDAQTLSNKLFTSSGQSGDLDNELRTRY